MTEKLLIKNRSKIFGFIFVFLVKNQEKTLFSILGKIRLFQLQFFKINLFIQNVYNKIKKFSFETK